MIDRRPSSLALVVLVSLLAACGPNEPAVVDDLPAVAEPADDDSTSGPFGLSKDHLRSVASAPPTELYGQIEVRTLDEGRVVALAVDRLPADGLYDDLFRLELADPIEPIEHSLEATRLAVFKLGLILRLDESTPLMLMLEDTGRVRPEDTPQVSGVALTRHAISTATPFGSPPWQTTPPTPDECTGGGLDSIQCTAEPGPTACTVACAPARHRACCAPGNRCACLEMASFTNATTTNTDG